MASSGQVQFLIVIVAAAAAATIVFGDTRRLTEENILPELFPLLGLAEPVHRFGARLKSVAEKPKIVVSKHPADYDEEYEQIQRQHQQHTELLGNLTNIHPGDEHFMDSERYKLYGNSTDEEIYEIRRDAVTKQLWGGECKYSDWVRCTGIQTWAFLEYFEEGIVKNFTMECNTFRWVCMKNGWTVNRCHLLCMSTCNREFQYKYDNWVKHDGNCDPISNKIPGS